MEINENGFCNHLNNIGAEFWAGLADEPIEADALLTWSGIKSVCAITMYRGVRRCGDELAVLVDLDCLVDMNVFGNVNRKVDKALIRALVEHSARKLWPTVET